MRPRILIADDDAAFAKVVAFNLDMAGFETTIACDGSEAWDYFGGFANPLPSASDEKNQILIITI